MAEQKQSTLPPNIRIWRYLPILIVFGLAVHLLLPQIATLENSWSVVQNMKGWAVILAALAQIVSYVGLGYTLHSILHTDAKPLSIWKGTLIAMASYSIGLVAGGTMGEAATMYALVRREDRDVHASVMAWTLPGMLNTAILVIVSLIGTSYLILVHDLTQTQLIEFSVVLLVMGLITFGVVAAFRFPERATKIVVWLASRGASLIRKPFDPTNTLASMTGFFSTWRALQNGGWIRPAIGAAINIGFDMLTLYFLFVAAGQQVSVGVLFAGYGLPFIVGKLAFIFPGGVGVMEASMAAMYTSLKVPNAVSVVVILGYRLFSFWIPAALGFIVAGYLSGNLLRGKKETTVKV